MFREILYVQWKWSRVVILLGVLTGFALPILSVRSWTAVAEQELVAGELLLSMQLWGYGYPLLSSMLALLVAITAWTPDHQGKHVYALSLPLPRWYYVLQKLGAGLVLLAPPTVAVLVGATVASTAASMPAGLQAYPLALTTRFGLTAAVAFSCFFAISSGTERAARLIFAPIAAALVIAELFSAGLGGPSILGYVVEHLFYWPGPLDIFGGRWMLIDV